MKIKKVSSKIKLGKKSHELTFFQITDLKIRELVLVKKTTSSASSKFLIPNS